MSPLHPLAFFWTSWTALISVAVVFVTAALGYVAWRRSGYRRSIGLLEAVRLALVIVIAILFNQPEVVEQYRPEEKPTVVVLYDASRSMETRDVVDPRHPTTPPRTRREAIADLTTPAAWQSLDERMDVIVQPFAEPREGHGTDLNAPLIEALEKHATLRGVVLISDGDWNEGDPPAEAATRLRLKNVPVFAVAVGSPTRLPDVELVSLDLPQSGATGKSVRVPFTIISSLARDHTATVKLRSDDGDELTKEVRVAAMSRTNDWMFWKPASAKTYEVTVEIAPHPDELILDNNRLSSRINIEDERLRVLIVESYPRWEYRYLRNALSRDPSVKLSSLLFHPGLSKVGGGNKDYIQQFPNRLEELQEFDVVFLGDVGLEDGQLTVEQCRLLKGLVEQQSSGLVFLPGWQGRQLSLLDTELSELYPVVLDTAQPGGWGTRTPDHFELTEKGRQSLLTKLADTQDENAAVWEDLPGFQWYAAVERAKAVADVLCVHKDAANEYGRIPLLATRTYGLGKVLFMGTDGAWRWRKGVEDKYHYRFWGQVVRWMAYHRHAHVSEQETVRMYPDPDSPSIRNTVTLYANIMSPGGEPVQNDDVTARITAPSGKAETVQFIPGGDEWGLYSAQFTPTEPGEHLVALRGRRSAASLDTSFSVQGGAIERVGHPPRIDVLEEIARVTQGKLVQVGELDTVLRTIASLPEPAPDVRRLQLWSSPWMAGCLVTLLGVFWVCRKAAGLI
ncbi:MAG TPA: hypothetical protein VJ783_09365 [Pirellulales bacterium]|nr:hypothetical protein [Pirellulales bacterium]